MTESVGAIMKLMLIISLTVGSTLCSPDKEDCLYYYVQQPPSLADCNPWPLLASAPYLPLHCVLLIPRSNQLASVEWYKNHSPLQIYSDADLKHSITSRDSDDNYRTVNFSLLIHNITHRDVGCYYCQVFVATDHTCQIALQPSTQFCLLEEQQYNTSACQSVPVNRQVVCAQPLSPTEASTGEPSMSLSTAIGSSIPGNVLGKWSPPAPQQRVREWLYIGVGVCCLMLAVILALLSVVVVLCRPPAHRKHKSTEYPLNNEVWRRSPYQNITSLINQGHLLLPPVAEDHMTSVPRSHDYHVQPRGQLKETDHSHRKQRYTRLVPAITDH